MDNDWSTHVAEKFRTQTIAVEFDGARFVIASSRQDDETYVTEIISPPYTHVGEKQDAGLMHAIHWLITHHWSRS